MDLPKERFGVIDRLGSDDGKEVFPNRGGIHGGQRQGHRNARKGPGQFFPQHVQKGISDYG
jgi:hypothetical protein